MHGQPQTATPDANDSGRVVLPRVRTGCLACKAAHVKCDEARPACRRCARSDRLCHYPSPADRRSVSTRSLPLQPKPLRQLLPASGLKHVNTKAESSAASSKVAISDSSSQSTVILLLDRPRHFAQLSDPNAALYFDRFKAQAVRYSSKTNDSDDFWFRTLLRETANNDCILAAVLAVGALAQALGNAPDHVALFAVNRANLPDPQQSSYRDAIRYYTSSIARLRRYLDAPEALHQAPSIRDTAPTKQGSNRAVLISSILYSAFELMHGNSYTADRIVAKSVSMLRSMILHDKQPTPRSSMRPQHDDRVFPPTPPPDPTHRISAQCDDAGIEEAEWLLIRRVTLGSLYAPLHPLGRDTILQLPNLNFTDGRTPPPLDANPTTYWKLYFRFMPFVALWYVRAESVPVPRYTGPGSGHDETNLDTEMQAQAWHREPLKSLLWEKDLLMQQIMAWESAVVAKMAATPDPEALAILLQILPSSKALRYSLLTILDPKGGTDRQEELRALATEIIELGEQLLDALPFVPQGRDEMRESAQSVGIRMCRNCRESANLRQRALALCRRLIDSHSRWDAKGLVMGMTKLVEMEEAGRDQQTGMIPISAQWDWTSGTWDKDFTELKVTYTSRTVPFRHGKDGLSVIEGSRSQQKLTLLPVDFGY